LSKKFLTPVGLPSGNTLPSVGSAGDLFFKADEDAVYVHDGSAWVNTKGNTYSVSETPPSSPSSGDIWFNSASGKTFVYYDSFWIEPGQNNVGPAGPTGPTGPAANTTGLATETYVDEAIANIYVEGGLAGEDGATGPTGPTGATGAGFNWRGEWQENASPAYQINDVVTYNGSTYRAGPLNFGSYNLHPQSPSNGTAWLLMAAKGQKGDGNWRGTWNTGIGYYALNDIVTYDGSAYISKTDNSNLSLPTDTEYWSIFASKGDDGSLNWRGEWVETPSPTPAVYDAFIYNGSSYVLISSSGSNQPPDNGQGSTNTGWQKLAAKGIDAPIYRGAWDSEELYYKIDDIVTYNGSSYISKTSNTYQHIPTNTESWDLFVSKGAAGEGFNWRGRWVSDVTYVLNDTVSYEGSTYVAVEPAKDGSWTNHPSVSGNDAWNILASGFNFRNEWSSTPSIPYIVNDVVLHEGNLYIAVPSIGGNSGNPVNDSGWSLLLPAGEGFTFRGEYDIDTPEPYEVNDLVSYKGSTWIGLLGSMNMGPMGTPGGSDSWQIFAAGLRIRGQWMSNPMDTLGGYTINDVVSYLGNSYVRTALPNPEETNPPTNEMGSLYPNWELLAAKGDTGSSANTGDITFDGIQIIGAGTASGDGYQNGTIELVPDANLALYSDQYLIIDPTSPNHIHIRAGGEQDDSSAHLYLGAERNNVEVSDPYRTVKIHTAPELITNTYVNTNPDSEQRFFASPLSDIQNGHTVNVDGINYVVDSTMPVDGQTFAWTASGAVFTAGQSYTFSYEQPYVNEWTFASDGILSGPAQGDVYLRGISGADGVDLRLHSSDSDIVLNSATGGEYLNDPTDPANQIATIGDINAGRFGASASYHSRVTQGPQASANLVQPFTFSTTDWQTGIERVDNTKIKMLNAGKYNIAFSAQLVQGNNNGTINIWLNKNGTPMAYTNTKVTIESNATYTVAAWNFFVDAATDDYYELSWSSTSTHTTIQYDAAQTINGNLHPEIPSIIVTVNQVG
jgi:hypothetical protein